MTIQVGAIETGATAGCPCVGLLADLVARLESIMVPQPWRRRRYASHIVCQDCHQGWSLTLAKKQHGKHH